MSQATEAMAKGPAPMKDNNAVMAGRPKITAMLIWLLELRAFNVLVQSIFWSAENKAPLECRIKH